MLNRIQAKQIMLMVLASWTARMKEYGYEDTKVGREKLALVNLFSREIFEVIDKGFPREKMSPIVKSRVIQATRVLSPVGKKLFWAEYKYWRKTGRDCDMAVDAMNLVFVGHWKSRYA